MADARQKLLDAISAFEDEYGSSGPARDLITDARMLERNIRSFTPEDTTPSAAEQHMRERMGEGYDKRPKSFDDVAESHAKRIAGDTADDEKETPSSKKTPAAEDDESEDAGRSD